VAGAYRLQNFWLDREFDASSDAGASSNEPRSPQGDRAQLEDATSYNTVYCEVPPRPRNPYAFFQKLADVYPSTTPIRRLKGDSFPAASEIFGTKIARCLVWPAAFMRASLRDPAPHSLRQHGLERVVAAPEMVVERCQSMKRNQAE
jgi:hypothetical protein